VAHEQVDGGRVQRDKKSGEVHALENSELRVLTLFGR
jgi:hypothetical protein